MRVLWTHLPVSSALGSLNELASLYQDWCCCILGEQLWMGIAWIACWGGKCSLKHSPVAWLRDMRWLWGWVCLLSLVVQSALEAGGLAREHILASVSLGLESTGLFWPRQFIFWCLNRTRRVLIFVFYLKNHVCRIQLKCRLKKYTCKFTVILLYQESMEGFVQ
jgi:hypothetical protein